MNAVVDSFLADQAAIRTAFAEARAKGLRAKDAAESIGFSEGAVVAAHAAAAHSLPMQAQTLSAQWFDILSALKPCGRVMALTRNEAVVHEKDGIYQGFSKEGPVALCNNEDIDLRIFMMHWHAGFAVMEPGRDGKVMRSLQFYDRHGMAQHKIYARADTDVGAWDAVVQRFADTGVQPQFVQPAGSAVIASDESIDAQGLRAAWAAMKDTHEFFGMLKRFACERQQSFRLTQGIFCDQLALNAVTPLLNQAAAQQVPIMVFVGSKSCIQIHSGPVHNIRALVGGSTDWINVLDPGFNLHLRRDLITAAWLVRKPTTDGVVTSVELFDTTGQVVAMFFGVRKPGRPELASWRTLAENLPRF
ncbi:hemin-degrading factor [Comamonas sp. NoAH]|uniref:hemin-degrading factor n=1 Tax=Comamonas halotolerans TaxID=3041496 RepID=UPI0024E08D3D|nr:ChuX/HutX family heme-like substrate-binding protein [Comamonas sp. NoAH]